MFFRANNSSIITHLVSQETSLITGALCPQNALIKPSNSQPSTSSSQQPNYNPNATIQTSQPSVSALAACGIKVRDFAYESVLPPIAPVPRVPRQVQLGPRPLKRARKDFDEDGDDDNPFLARSPTRLGTSSQLAREGETNKKLKPLERKSTEPADQNIPSSRARGFADLSIYDPHPNYGSRALTPIRIPVTDPGPSNSQENEFFPSQPSLQYASQDSESYIDTPLVTPNGSLHWNVTDTSDLPASQLDTASMQPAPALLSFSEVGFSSHAWKKDESPALSSPLSSPPSSSPCLGPQLSRTPSTSSMPHSSAHTLADDPMSIQSNRASPLSLPQPPQRYFLRKRQPAAPQTPTKSKVRIANPSSPPPMAFLVQSAHSRAKDHRRSSSRSKTLRKSDAISGHE